MDEADVAKLSGDLLITLNEGRLNVAARVRPDGHPRGQLNLAPQPDPRQLPGDVTDEKRAQFAPSSPFMPQQLLVHENRAIAIGQLAEVYPAGATKIADLMPAMSLRTRLAEVDLTDPAKPRLVRTADVDGSVVGARLVAGVLRLAVTNPPSRHHVVPPDAGARRLDPEVIAGPRPRGQPQGGRRRRARRVAAELPGDRRSTRPARGRRAAAAASSAARTSRRRSSSPASTRSRSSAPTSRAPASATCAAAASWRRARRCTRPPEHTYVATAAWQDLTAKGASQAWRPGAEETAVHQFATEDRTGSRYVASGRVPGTLLNQFAMDEHEGVLRVATTTQGTGTAVVEDAPSPRPTPTPRPRPTAAPAAAATSAPAPSRRGRWPPARDPARAG